MKTTLPLINDTGGCGSQSNNPKLSKPISEADLEKEVQAYEELLRKQLGLHDLHKKEPEQFKRPHELSFSASERDQVTILYGGLTLAHEHIIKGALEGLGYNVDYLPCPDNESLQIGKEYGNRGQCNPTYYTVGNVVKFCEYLRDTVGMPTEEIEKKYVFLTAGACGPCRFGMYEAEYRKALMDAGFPNFRVLLFQQSGGLSQSSGEAGLVLNAKFFAGIIKGMISGDILNQLGYAIRPYEINRGETDQMMAKAREYLRVTLREGKPFLRALREVRKMFEKIEVDYTRLKPKVKIIGEFWAQTTEGDGNYHMFKWLEEEGAEVIVEPIGTWIGYSIYTAQAKAKERIGVQKGRRSLILKLGIAKTIFHAYYNICRAAVGFKVPPLVSQRKLAKYAKHYYDVHVGGGEGYMEVGKNIMAVTHKKANMVISLKPFGCMPSTQSDGVQSKVVSDYKDAIYIPIETSGDGEINVKSRVQMKLYEAKQKAKDEFAKVLEKYKVTPEQVREYVESHKEYANPIRKLPHKVVTTAGNFIAFMAKRVRS